MKHSTFHNSIRDDVMYSKARLWPLSRNTWAAAAAAARARSFLRGPHHYHVPVHSSAPSATFLSTRARGYSISLSLPLSRSSLLSSSNSPISFVSGQSYRIVSSSSYINTPSLQSAAILVTSFVRMFVCKFHMQFSSCSAAKQLYYGPPAWVTLTKKF